MWVGVGPTIMKPKGVGGDDSCSWETSAYEILYSDTYILRYKMKARSHNVIYFAHTNTILLANEEW